MCIRDRFGDGVARVFVRAGVSTAGRRAIAEVGKAILRFGASRSEVLREGAKRAADATRNQLTAAATRLSRAATSQQVRDLGQDILISEALNLAHDFAERHPVAEGALNIAELFGLSARQQMVHELWSVVRRDYGVNEVIEESQDLLEQFGGPSGLREALENGEAVPAVLIRTLGLIVSTLSAGVDTDLFVPGRFVSGSSERVEDTSRASEPTTRTFTHGLEGAVFYHPSSPTGDVYRSRSSANPCEQAGSGKWVFIAGNWERCP